jgi:hypothetical protein
MVNLLLMIRSISGSMYLRGERTCFVDVAFHVSKCCGVLKEDSVQMPKVTEGTTTRRDAIQANETLRTESGVVVSALITSRNPHALSN